MRTKSQDELSILRIIAEHGDPNVKLMDPASLDARIIAGVLHLQQRRIELFMRMKRSYKTLISLERFKTFLAGMAGFIIGAAIEHYFPGIISRLWR